MKLENQVCTLEQGKKLKKLGVTSDGIQFKWVEYLNFKLPMLAVVAGSVSTILAPAFTVAELGVMLPKEMYSHQLTNGSWCCENIFANRWNNKTSFSETEAEARAAMLIYLLENNLITAEEVNQRLTTP